MPLGAPNVMSSFLESAQSSGVSMHTSYWNYARFAFNATRATDLAVVESPDSWRNSWRDSWRNSCGLGHEASKELWYLRNNCGILNRNGNLGRFSLHLVEVLTIKESRGSKYQRFAAPYGMAIHATWKGGA